MDYEKRFPEDWHLALTTTEFLVTSDLRALLEALDPTGGVEGGFDSEGGSVGNRTISDGDDDEEEGTSGGGSMGAGTSGGGSGARNESGISTRGDARGVVNDGTRLVRFPSVVLVGSDVTPFDSFAPLLRQRSAYAIYDLNNKCE